MKCLIIVVAAIACLAYIAEVQGHGMITNPPGRSTRWREDPSAPPNYDDSGLYCGGLNVQHQTYGGKCGLCGDSYGAPQPRPNELGGTYGQGVITRSYRNTRTANVNFKITVNHIGFVYFELCNLDQYGRETEECFLANRLRFPDGSDKMHLGTAMGDISATIVLPEGLLCHRCVLRWIYEAGNNWGYCHDGSGALGCGPQETFKNCADISIFPHGFRSILEPQAEKAETLELDVPEVVEYVPEVPEEIKFEFVPEVV